VSDSASLFSHFVSTRGTFRWLSALVIVSSAAAWVAVGFDVAKIRLLGRQMQEQSVTAGERAAHVFVGDVVFQVQMTLLAATGIAFVTWLYRARANLRAFGTRHLRFQRNWAIFGFVIPLLNLIRPYQVVQEVWQASDPETTGPLAWREVAPSRLVQLWWTTFIGFVVIKSLAWWMQWSASYDATKLQIGHGVELLADVLAAVSVTLVYFVIERITDAQQAKWKRLSPPLAG
jgi:hypothetical protein